MAPIIIFKWLIIASMIRIFVLIFTSINGLLTQFLQVPCYFSVFLLSLILTHKESCTITHTCTDVCVYSWVFCVLLAIYWIDFIYACFRTVLSLFNLSLLIRTLFQIMVTIIWSWGFVSTKFHSMRKSKSNLEWTNT